MLSRAPVCVLACLILSVGCNGKTETTVPRARKAPVDEPVTPRARKTPAAAESFRVIGIKKREHGYSNFQSTVIRTDEEYAAFMKAVKGQTGWNDRSLFQQALAAAKVDFRKEALVLLRHTEPSGSVKVTFGEAKAEYGMLLCEVDTVQPAVGTGDMAYYCFAVAVDKSKIRAVELKVGGKKQRLPVTVK